MLDKNTANEAYAAGRCHKLFAYSGNELARQGFIPGEWLKKHLDAANNPNKTFLVYDNNSIGLYEIVE